VDWLILEFLTLRANAAGFTRYILKDVLRLVPVYGFMINRHGGIFVRRKGGRDKDNIHNALQKIADDKRPVWLCMFPEGTRYDSTKVTVMEKSKAFAKSHGLPPLKNVLTPRTTGFETVMEVGRKYFTSVYDVTIMYEAYEAIGNGNGKLTTPPNVFTFIGGACKRVHVHLHRKEMSELPEEPEQIKSWLYERYSEKDKILDTLSSTINTPNQPPPTASIPRANIPPISDLRLTLAFILGAGALLFHLLHSYGPWLWVVTLVTYSFLGIVIAYVPLPF
jgi:1-acyl-sn-glycerol-3-phosphate acyltransferase